MAVTEQRTLPAQFVETLGKDLATQITGQSGIPMVSTGIAGISQQPGETAAAFKATDCENSLEVPLYISIIFSELYLAFLPFKFSEVFEILDDSLKSIGWTNAEASKTYSIKPKPYKNLRTTASCVTQ